MCNVVRYLNPLGLDFSFSVEVIEFLFLKSSIQALSIFLYIVQDC